jgi:HD-GYP domain-containing protein (c-di-GMP phosphodiesterase class II)
VNRVADRASESHPAKNVFRTLRRRVGVPVRSVHWLPLLLCLVFGGGMFSAVFGGLTYYLDGKRVEHLFVASALEETARFVAETPTASILVVPSNRSVIEHGLQDLVTHDSAKAQGYYVTAKLCDADHDVVAMAIRPGIEPLDKAREGGRCAFSKKSGDDDEVFVVDGKSYIRLTIALRNDEGVVGAYLEGLFRIWPASSEIAHSNTTWNTVTVALSVLMTPFFLYPIILFLNSNTIRQSRNLIDAHMDTLKVLGSAIAKRDSETGHHNFRVVLFSVRLAEAAGLSFGEIHSLLKGAFLHDVGKIAISDSILLKPGRLGQTEFEVMKTHVSHGVEIVRQSHWLVDAIDVVRFHHEKYDGSGYLEGRSGENIPINARVFAIVDVFDALTSERPYKKAMPLNEALKIMEKGYGSHFDPRLLKIFMSIIHSIYAEYSGMTEDSLAKKLKSIGDMYGGYSNNMHGVLCRRHTNASSL